MRVSPFLSFVRRSWLLIFALIALGVTSSFATDEKEQKIQAKLIWGTDEPKPANPKIKPVDPKLKEKFSGIFKWKNYFEVEEKHFALAPEALKKVQMSTKCDIEVRNEGHGMFEVRFLGEGKSLKRVRQVIPPGELLVIAGDDKNANAWFVVLNLE
jgi:hypothetical protein